jgi:hypothetical protein
MIKITSQIDTAAPLLRPPIIREVDPCFVDTGRRVNGGTRRLDTGLATGAFGSESRAWLDDREHETQLKRSPSDPAPAHPCVSPEGSGGPRWTTPEQCLS